MGHVRLGCTADTACKITQVLTHFSLEQANVELAATYAALILADDNVEITVRIEHYPRVNYLDSIVHCL